ncbi:MAG: TetR/AcrR family transcriptional regulator [Bacteroidetes bacterium]|nr:TetR/AcrR family transcriptional regulator [Bacteroidota bacterium]
MNENKLCRRTKILNAFTELVSRFGVEKTTMSDIARNVGCSVGTLYNEFKDKEELIYEFFLEHLNNIISRLEEIKNSELPPEEKLHQMIPGNLKFVIHELKDNSLFAEYLRSNTVTVRYLGQPELISRKVFRKKYVSLIESVLEEGIRAGVFEVEDTASAASILSDSMDTYALRVLIMQEKPKKNLERAELMFQMLLKSIKKNDSKN